VAPTPGDDKTGDDVDQDGQREQLDAETDQGGTVKAPRLAELVGDDRRHRVADPNNAAEMRGLEPMTSAAAMVSPIARPSPSMIALTMPALLCGKTAARTISQRVEPSA